MKSTYLETLFGSPGRIRVLRTLSAADAPVTGRQLAELAGMSQPGAWQAVEALAELGVVGRRRVGRATTYWLNRENFLTESVVEPALSAEKDLLRTLLLDLSRAVKGEATQALVFGSFARGEQGPGSDVDLLVVVPDEHSRERLNARLEVVERSVFGKYHAALSPKVLLEDEFRADRSLPYIEQAVREGLDLLDPEMEAEG